MATMIAFLEVVSCNAALSACNSGAVVRRLGSIKAVDGPYGKLCSPNKSGRPEVTVITNVHIDYITYI